MHVPNPLLLNNLFKNILLLQWNISREIIQGKYWANNAYYVLINLKCNQDKKNRVKGNLGGTSLHMKNSNGEAGGVCLINYELTSQEIIISLNSFTL